MSLIDDLKLGRTIDSLDSKPISKLSELDERDFDDIPDLDFEHLKNHTDPRKIDLEMLDKNINGSNQGKEPKIKKDILNLNEEDLDEDDEEDGSEIETDDEEKSSIAKYKKLLANGKKHNLKDIVIVIVGLIVVFIFVKAIFFGKTITPSGTDEETQPTPNVSTPLNILKEDEYLKDYPEYVNVSSDYFSDEIVVTKYIKIQNNNLTYVFSGIPKHFQKSIHFEVKADTYNKVSTGNKIFIDYSIYNVEGVDYLTNVTTNMD